MLQMKKVPVDTIVQQYEQLITNMKECCTQPMQDKLAIIFEDNKEQIISLLNEKTDVSLDNIPVLDECIIHLSICEFLFINKSKSIIINEYINIAKKYSSPKMYTFLNKILDKTL